MTEEDGCGWGTEEDGWGWGWGATSGIVCKIVNWKLIGEGGRELADFGLVTIILTYSPHRIIRILQSPMGVHKEKRDHENILHRSPPPPSPCAKLWLVPNYTTILFSIETHFLFLFLASGPCCLWRRLCAYGTWRVTNPLCIVAVFVYVVCAFAHARKCRG